MTDLSRASAPDDGVARRTILAGAAWSIPVIATATVAPAASASGTLALAFNQASYSGTACSTITGAYVTATTNGMAAAGVPITVTLSDGYTFTGGATSAVGISDPAGRFTLPAIAVPAGGGASSPTAVSATASVSATLTAQPKSGTFVWFDASNSYHTAVSAVPANSTPAVGSLFLAPDGRLISGETGSTIISGVASVGLVTQGYYAVALKDGTFQWCDVSNTFRSANSAVPANSTPAIGNLFLAPDGRLISGETGFVVAAGVASVGPVTQGYYGIVLKNGRFGWCGVNNVFHNASSAVPANSTPAIGNLFLTPDGRLISAETGATVLSGVSLVGPESQGYFPVSLKNGDFGWYDPSITFHAANSSVPANSTPAVGTWFLAPDGRLVSGSTGSTVATDVTEIGTVTQGFFPVRRSVTC